MKRLAARQMAMASRRAATSSVPVCRLLKSGQEARLTSQSRNVSRWWTLSPSSLATAWHGTTETTFHQQVPRLDNLISLFVIGGAQQSSMSVAYLPGAASAPCPSSWAARP